MSEPPQDVVFDSESAEDEPNASPPVNETLRNAVEWVGVIVAALAAALLVQAFAFQAFQIPSGSMTPTVNVGDRILVNKLSYRFGEVQRGDLVVFDRLEGTPGLTDQLIKRAIALPGETLELREDGRLYVWGPGEGPEDALMLEESYLAPENVSLDVPDIADPISLDIWNERCVNQPRTAGRCTLNDSSYYMLGDNRNRSTDSRVFGPIPVENIVGRAFARIWPLDDLGGL